MDAQPKVKTFDEFKDFLSANLITDVDGKKWRLSIHDAATLLPYAEGKPYIKLRSDIQKYGLKEPLKVANVSESEGICSADLIDGITRLRACIELGRPPQIKTTEASDPVALVLSLNLQRRHLSIGQRALMAIRLVEGGGYKDSVGKNYTLPKAAELFDVSLDTVNILQNVIKHAPDLADKVRLGTMAPNAAYQEWLKRRKQQYEDLAFVHPIDSWNRDAALKSYAPDLAEAVDKSELSPNDAWFLFEHNWRWQEEWQAYLKSQQVAGELPSLTPELYGKPAEPQFVADLKATITVMKDYRRRMDRIMEYTRLRQDVLPETVEGSVIHRFDQLMLDFQHFVNTLKKRQFIPSDVETEGWWPKNATH